MSAAVVIHSLRLNSKILQNMKYMYNIYEPTRDKTYNKTCVTSKDSDQSVYPPSMARVLVHPYLDSQEAVEGTWDQQTQIRLRGC